MQTKHQQLEVVLSKWTTLERLIERNLSTRKDGGHADTAAKVAKFPFVVVQPQGGTVSVEHTKTGTALAIKSQHPMSITGDLECLSSCSLMKRTWQTDLSQLLREEGSLDERFDRIKRLSTGPAKHKNHQLGKRVDPLRSQTQDLAAGLVSVPVPTLTHSISPELDPSLKLQCRHLR